MLFLFNFRDILVCCHGKRLINNLVVDSLSGSNKVDGFFSIEVSLTSVPIG